VHTRSAFPETNAYDAITADGMGARSIHVANATAIAANNLIIVTVAHVANV
jgi:hypothetical protein